MRKRINCLAVKLFTVLFLTIISSALFAQKRVTGTVIGGKDNLPVSGASVVVKGTTVGVTTGTDGKFSINVPSGSKTLVVSYIGYGNYEADISSASEVNVTLQERAASLDEIVVTGYTSQKKKDITGSVSVVKVSDLQSQPAADAQTQLQGRASGITITQDNVPGNAATVRIRGFSSFNNNDPLYVIDGVPTTTLVGLNPNDIESMQVLKDAASASIYGSRASNGVIVITTKRGKGGVAKVAYDMYVGTQDPGKGFTNLMGSQGVADLTWLALKNSGKTLTSDQYGSSSTPVLPDYIFASGSSGVKAGDPLTNPNLYDLNYSLLGTPGYSPNIIVAANKTGTDWFKEMTRDAPIMSHNISAAGANDKSRYFFSFNYFDQKSILKYNYYKRYTVRANTEFNIKNVIRIGENIQIFTSDRNTGANNGEGTNVGYAYREQPIIPVYTIVQGDFAGSKGSGLGNSKNPVASLYRARNNRAIDLSLLGNMYAEVDLFRHFTARTSFGGNFGYYDFHTYPAIEYENAENNVNVTYGEGFGRNQSWTWTNQMTYKNTFGNHDLTVLVGSEAVKSTGRNAYASRQTYYTYDNLPLITLNTGTGLQQASGSPYTSSSLFSLFGKVDYAYNNKYLLSFTLRRDGSSRFGSDNRYGTFPAGSIGWRITQEGFANNISWLNDLKLRASYGTAGGQFIGPDNQYTYFSSGPAQSGYAFDGTNTTIGNYLYFIGNTAGKWETNETGNIGFDATLFKGNTDIAFDVYQKKTNNLLFNAEQTALAGAPTSQRPPAFNVGSMKNWGIDLQISQRANIGGPKGVKFDGTLTFTTYKNTITNIAQGFSFFDADFGESGRIGGVFTRNAVGQPINSFYGYQVIGLFQDSADVAKSPVQKEAAPGRFKYEDRDGNDTITDADRTFFGNPNPDFSYGVNLSFSYKGFDLTGFFYGVSGKHNINYTRWWTDFYPSFQGGKSKDALNNSWTPTRTDAKIPIQETGGTFSTNGIPNSYYLENASYLRLKNLQIGYNLPASILNKLKIDRFRVYVQATNLFTITKYTGLDPEVTNYRDSPGASTSSTFSGIDAGAFPSVKQYLVGANVSF